MTPIKMTPVCILRKTPTDSCHVWQLWYHAA